MPRCAFLASLLLGCVVAAPQGIAFQDLSPEFVSFLDTHSAVNGTLSIGALREPIILKLEANTWWDVSASKAKISSEGLLVRDMNTVIQGGVKPCTQCTAGSTYQTEDCTDTSDRVCGECSKCIMGEHLVTACNVTHDTVCIACQCVAHSLFRTAGSCEFDCIDDTFRSGDICADCTKCSATQWLTSECTPTSDSVCSSCTNCVAGETYQTKDCSATSDRQCSACTTCAVGFSTTTECTPTSNTVCTACPALENGQFNAAGSCEFTCNSGYTRSGTTCKACTQCSANQFQTSACTAEADAKCSACTTCLPGKTYQAKACGATEDRECSACATCELGFETTAACTTTSNTVCTPCPSLENGKLNAAGGCEFTCNSGYTRSGTTCKACTQCSATQFQTGACTAEVDTQCTACTTCPAGQSYQTQDCSATANRQCTACTQCGANQYQSQACTPTSNTQCTACTACVSGQTYQTQDCSATADRQCSACSTCALGFETTAACTPTSNTVCTACPSLENGQYNAAGSCQFTCNSGYTRSGNACKACTQCASGQYQTSACTAEADTQCTACTTCVSGQTYQTQDCSATSNRVCSPCSSCGGNQYQSQACTTTSNTQCATCTSCVSGQTYQTQDCSATADRQCSACSTCASGYTVSAACTTTSNTVCAESGFSSCEHESKTLSCPAGQVVSIRSVFYGRFDANTCGSNSNTQCSSRTFGDQVRKECEARNSCTVQASNSFASGDPCYGVFKYAKYEIACNQLVKGQNYACEGQNVQLSCPSDKPVILINSAFYGRRDSSLCPGSNTQTTTCSASDAMIRASTQCAYRRGSCSLPSSNNLYGDPCGGVTKYTTVDYSCAAEEPKLACEGNSASISCSNGKKIHIIDAFYGRVASSVCPGANSGNTNCGGNHSFRKKYMTKVQDSCEGKSSCSFTASNSVAGDPCGGTYKYMAIRHECL